MREILFRAKCIDNGEWVYGVPIKKALAGSHDGYYPKIIPECDGRHQTIYSTAIKEETLGQYTGLTDKNGTKIFEGDILCVRYRGKTGSRICPVYFGEYIDADSVFDNYRCIGFYIKTSNGCGTIGALLDEEFEFEVIGNIFDNHELLEGKT